MLFLLTAFALESKCNNTYFFQHGKKKMPPAAIIRWRQSLHFVYMARNYSLAPASTTTISPFTSF